MRSGGSGNGPAGPIRGRAEEPVLIRRNGYIVAFTVTLAAPTAEQVAFFNDNFGEPAEVGLSVLRKSKKRKTRLNYRLVNQSQLFEVEDYFGSKPTFVLNEPMRVRKTNWIAITVPTWAPIFANNLTRSDWWRSSRAKNSCETPRSLNQVRDDRAARGQRVRLHLQRRAAPLHRHLCARSEAHGRRTSRKLGVLELSTAADPR